jgi:hypothetical protein
MGISAMPASRRQSLDLSDRCAKSGGANLHKSVVLVSSRLRRDAHFFLHQSPRLSLAKRESRQEAHQTPQSLCCAAAGTHVARDFPGRYAASRKRAGRLPQQPPIAVRASIKLDAGSLPRPDSRRSKE